MASPATIKKVLKIHEERKYKSEVPTVSQLVFNNLPPVNFLQRSPKNEKNAGKDDYPLAYYTIDKTNKSPEDYFNINYDVNTFARNYDQVRRISNYTTELKAAASFIAVPAASKPRKIKLEGQKERSRSMLSQKSEIVTLPQMPRRVRNILYPKNKAIKMVKVKSSQMNHRLSDSSSKIKFKSYIRFIRVCSSINNLTTQIAK